MCECELFYKIVFNNTTTETVYEHYSQQKHCLERENYGKPI